MLIGKVLLVIAALAIAILVVAKPLRSVVMGHPVVIDGETLRFDDVTVDLWGIDALEFTETCHSGTRRWNCGAFAFAATYSRIGDSLVWCFARGERADARVSAKCFAGFSDLAKSLVRRGWAFSDAGMSGPYSGDEARARVEKAGAWSSTFRQPLELRQAQPR